MTKNPWDLPINFEHIRFGIHGKDENVRKKVNRATTIIISEMEDIVKRTPNASKIRHALRLLRMRGAIEGKDYFITRDVRVVSFLHLYTPKHQFLSLHEDDVCKGQTS